MESETMFWFGGLHDGRLIGSTRVLDLGSILSSERVSIPFNIIRCFITFRHRWDLMVE
jgi:hypothetical protein